MNRFAPTGEIVVGDPLAQKLADLMDLKSGSIWGRDTSYSGTQNEVQEMHEAIKKFHWPGPWYELIQGAFERDNPQIHIYLPGAEKPVSLNDFIAQYKKIGGIRQIARVEIINEFTDDGGLRPFNLTLTEHRVAVKGVDDLSAHGRGIKVAATEFASRGNSKKISFLSCASGLGTWYAEAEITGHPKDNQEPPSLKLKIKNDEQLTTNKTVITVEEPSPLMIESLVKLPEYFLLTNSKYEYAQATNEPKVPNLLTVGLEKADKPHYAVFDKKYLKVFAGTENPQKKDFRIEILDRQLLENPPGNIDFVFVDGLRVNVPGLRFSQIYSFWGMRDNIEGYNPSRSNDSLQMKGDCSWLVSGLYKHCDQPQVWEQLIRESTIDRLSRPYEASITLNSQSLEPNVKLAVAQAFDAYTASLTVPVNTVWGYDHNIVEMIHAYDPFIPVRQIHSKDLFDTIKSSHPNFPSAYAKQEELHLLEYERSKRATEEQRKLKVQAEKRAADLARGRTGISKPPESTQEFMQIPSTTLEVYQEVATQQLLYTLATTGGKYERNNGSPEFVIPTKEIYGTPPAYFRDLGVIQDIAVHLLPALGQRHYMNVRIFDEYGKGYVFDLFLVKTTSGQAFGISPQVGQLDNSKFAGNIYISFGETESNSQSGMKAFTQAFDLLSRPYRVNESFNKEKFLASELAQDLPSIRAKAEINRTKRELRRFASKINVLRKKFGLTPLTEDYLRSLLEADDPSIEPERSRISGRGKKKNSQERDFSAPEHDGVAVFRQVLKLIHPEVQGGLSTEEGNANEGVGIGEKVQASFIEKIMNTLRATLSPDFQLASMTADRQRGYLIVNIPGIELTSYNPLADLAYGKKSGVQVLRFNRELSSGMGSLYCPPGHRPVGYYHPRGPQEFKTSGNLRRNVFAMNLPHNIPAGLEVYYAPTNLIDNIPPTIEEAVSLAETRLLSQPWQELISSLNMSNLNDKEKSDIIIASWYRVFQYRNDSRTFAQYRQYRDDPGRHASEVINRAVGNCGYAADGLRNLLALAGVPSRVVDSYCSPAVGNFSSTANYHALTQAWLDNHWVLIEPQSGYLDKDYNLGTIPAEFHTMIESLPLSNLRRNPSTLGAFTNLGLRDFESLSLEITQAIGEMYPLLRRPMEFTKMILAQLDLLRSNQEHKPEAGRFTPKAAARFVVGASTTIALAGMTMALGHSILNSPDQTIHQGNLIREVIELFEKTHNVSNIGALLYLGSVAALAGFGGLATGLHVNTIKADRAKGRVRIGSSEPDTTTGAAD